MKLSSVVSGLCILSCAIYIQGNEFQSRDLSPISSEMWGLPSPEDYAQIFNITPENLASKVLESDDVWIVLFYRSSISTKWKNIASSLSGAVWFGTVDMIKHPELLKRLNLNIPLGEDKNTVAVIFPMKNGKKFVAIEDGTLKFSSDSKKALELASTYIPDKTTDMTFSEDQMQKFNDWVIKGYYYEQPPKFPVICIVDEKQTPIYLKVAAYYLTTHFNIGVVRKANVPAMRRAFKQVPDPKTYPTYLVLLGIEPTTEEMNSGSFQMRFNIMPYIEQKYGNPRHFSSLVNYLFVANSDYRRTLPGRQKGEPENVSKMDEIRDLLTQRLVRASALTSIKSKLEL